MNKEYKCLQTYPVANKGDVVRKHEGTFPEYFNIRTGKRYTSTEIENYPSYWEEIIELCVPIGTKFKTKFNDKLYTIGNVDNNIITVRWPDGDVLYTVKSVNEYFIEKHWIIYEEKDYEILELLGNINKLIHKVKNEIVYRSNNKEEYLMAWGSNNVFELLEEHPTSWKINSIKRLSDGEIFTIGDKVKLFNKNDTQTIKSFEVDLESIRFRFDNGCGALLKYFPNPDDIKKVKDPLFITDDGVNIYDSEKILYLVNPVNCSMITIKACHWDKTRLIFSTEEAANEYIKLHKPVLSYNDVINLYDSTKLLSERVVKYELMELVKSKIK